MTTRPLSRSLLAAATCAVLAVGLTSATATAEGPLAAPVDGAAGIGDPYWPLDGNGGIDVTSYDIRNSYALRHEAARRPDPRRAHRHERPAQLLPRLPARRLEGDRRRRAADFAKTDGGHELRITPAEPLLAGTDHAVVVSYADHPATHSYAGEMNWLATGREVVTMNEPHMAPWWFPSNDHPQDKAIVDVRIRVPNGREVISNGELKGRRVGKRSTTWHWRADEPMAPYLAFFAAGDFTIAQGVRHGLPWLVAVSQSARPGRRGGQHAADAEDAGQGGRRAREGPRRLPVLGRRRAHHLDQRRLRAGEPDPADLSRGRQRLHQPRGARARPPVVRRRRRRPAVARHLAQRGLRDLHGVALVGEPRRSHGGGDPRRPLRRTSPPRRTSGRSSSPTPAPPRSSTTRSTAAVR